MRCDALPPARVASSPLLLFLAPQATIFYLAYGSLPYPCKRLYTLLDNIRDDPVPFPPRASDTVSTELRDFMEALLMKDPGGRPTVKDLRSKRFPWIGLEGEMDETHAAPVVADEKNLRDAIKETASGGKLPKVESSGSDESGLEWAPSVIDSAQKKGQWQPGKSDKDFICKQAIVSIGEQAVAAGVGDPEGSVTDGNALVARPAESTWGACAN